MQTTIDAAGRIVVPKAIRDELGLSAGQSLQICARGGRIEIEGTPTPTTLVRRGKSLVAVPGEPLPTLTAELVRSTLEQVRR